MPTASYRDRQGFEMERWPELRQKFNELATLVFSERELGKQIKYEVFTVSSLASGCRHCQSHGAVHLDRIGVDHARIQALWQFESSALFSEADRAALHLAMAAGVVPNCSRPEHFEALRQHYSDTQIIELVAVIALGGWLNRWNDTFATVTDQESVDVAMAVLAPVGWELGKHTGGTEEQRQGHPTSVGWVPQ